MPYYLHAKDTTATDGRVFSSRAEAFTAQKLASQTATHKITFVASVAETDGWIDRELARFDSGDYVRVPWAEHVVRYTGMYRYADGTLSDERYRDPEPANPDSQLEYGERIQNPLYLHFAHISLMQPGTIAYTKNEENGVRDVQTRVRPGKYLAEFFPNLSQPEVIAYCGMCNAEALSLKIATSEEEITRVYLGGPSSCMKMKFPNLPKHPTTAYASTKDDGTPLPYPSDLAIAYFGDASAARARCVVWPDKKRYGRTYGDESTLRALLVNAGFTNGTMAGAHVRAIKHGSGYVMPYVDGIDRCDLSDRSHRFILGNGEYSCQETSGYSGEDDSRTCDNCNDWYVYDPDGDYAHPSYCPACYEDSYTCEGCSETVWGDDVHCTDNGAYCADCWESTSTECDCCGRDFNAREFSYQTNQRRRRAGTPETVCENCTDCTMCEHCDDWQHGGEVNCDCRSDDDDTNEESPTEVPR